MKMRKTFFLVLMGFLMASFIANAEIIEVGITAGILDILTISFNDASTWDWWILFEGRDSTTISWDGTEHTLGPAEDDSDVYLESAIYTLRVESSTTWDLMITMPTALQTVDGYSAPLSWQFGTSATLAGTEYTSGSLIQKNIANGNYTWYMRFRIAYHWGMAPGEYLGKGSIVAVML